MEINVNLAGFFAWARPRAFRELEVRLQNNPSLDPNWTFSDIMQELLAQYEHTHSAPTATLSTGSLLPSLFGGQADDS